MFAFATARPVAVLMITTAAALFGVLAYRQLGLELMPDLAYPTLTIRTTYAGAAPEEIEGEITRLIEARVGTVEALVGMHSSSRAGLSEVVLEFDWDTDMDRAAQRVRERMARLQLPKEVERPLLLRYDPALVPVMSLGISGESTLTDLRQWALERLTPELSKIEGVAAVRVLGGREREVQVRLHEAAIAARGLSVAQVVQRLRAANVNLAGGTLKEGSVEFLVRTLAELRTADEVRRVVVLESEGAFLRLEDVAEVVSTTRERRNLVRVGGREAVRVDIFRQAGANIVEVCDAVRDATFGTPAQQRFATALAEGKDPPKGKQAGKGRGGERRQASRAARQRRQMTDFIAHRKPKASAIDVLGDQSVFIRAALDEVKGAAFSGGILAIIVLFLFLRSGYSTIVIAVAIPLSVAVTFAPLLLFDVSLNIMSLGGLALGIGMLVDNSVVVLESIFRCREEGDEIKAAAIRGTKEVGGAVVASTLTTVAVFFPIVFVQGVAGQVFGDLALAVVFSLLASLGVALFVVPMLASRDFHLHPSVDGPRRWSVAFTAWPAWRRAGVLRKVVTLPYMLLQTLLEALGNLLILLTAIIALPLWGLFRGLRWLVGKILFPALWLAQTSIEGLRAGYRRLLAGALRAPLLVLLLIAGALAWSWQALSELGAELIPEVRQGVLTAELRFPVGTPLADTSARAGAFEAAMARAPLVDRVEAFVGEPEGGEDDATERGPHTASVTLRLKPEGELAARERKAARAIRRAAASVPGAELELTRPSLFSLRPPIRVVILGHHLGQLQEAASAVRQSLEQVEGLSDLRSSMRRGYPELQIAYDRQKLAALGLRPREVAEGLRAQIEGEVATELRQREARVDVRVRADPERVASRSDLASLVVNPGMGVPLPLEAVAELAPGEGPAEIRRVDGQRAAVISGGTESFDLGTASQRVRDALAPIELPKGFELRQKGQDEEMEGSLESLKYALLLAIFLVYGVMASQFESLRAPLVIMGSVPLAAVGVVLALQALAIPLSVVVFVGLITLAGIVVNNAIVLVDYAQQLEGRGLSVEEALIEAGATRLRPILMTTLTTVLGLLPLAIGAGEGAELRQPMAVTLIAGLICSTLLTLVVIPVLYRLVVGSRAAAG